MTWLNNHFANKQLNAQNFAAAINAAKQVIEPHTADYSTLGWSLCMGASGTIQAVNEVNTKQKLESTLTLSLLNNIKQQCIDSGQIEQLQIAGLKTSRKPVFASGLSILIALFECLQVENIKPSKGALREGLISILFEGDSFLSK